MATDNDPFARNWRIHDEHGPLGLGQIDPALAVLVPDTQLAMDALDWHRTFLPQEAELSEEDLRVMVLADAKPMAPVHLDVVGHRPVPYLRATTLEKDLLDGVARWFELFLSDRLRPAHGMAVVRFGQEVPTMHEHVIAREQREDGMDWTARRPLLSVPGRKEMIRRVGLDASASAELRKAFARTLIRFCTANG
jgi:diadenosine tetraphosphate (Ap4A) HIT family hydrolase